jgi:hypothetical protein
MPRKPKPKKPTVPQLIKGAALLSDAELRSLMVGLAELEEERNREVERDKYGKPVNQKGHIEERWINGCGPYFYLRWWEEGKHRSAYLGKDSNRDLV